MRNDKTKYFICAILKYLFNLIIVFNGMPLSKKYENSVKAKTS